MAVTMAIFVLAINIRFKVEIAMLKFERMPFVEEVFIVLALFIATLAVIRSMNRWGAKALVRSIEDKGRARFASRLSLEGRRWTILFHMIEVLISFVFAGFFYWVLPEAQPVSAVIGLMGLEQLVFLFSGLRLFGVVVSSDEVVTSGRALNIISLHNIRSVEMLHDDIHFINTRGKIKKIDRRIIPAERMEEFASTIENILEERSTYVSPDLLRGSGSH